MTRKLPCANVVVQYIPLFEGMHFSHERHNKMTYRFRACCETAQVPGFVTRDYVVANVHDGTNLTFASSSALHGGYPGGSCYQTEVPVVSGWSLVRNAFAGAYSCEPISGEDNACFLRVWQWVDLGGWAPNWLCHQANLRWFDPFYKRIRARVEDGM